MKKILLTSCAIASILLSSHAYAYIDKVAHFIHPETGQHLFVCGDTHRDHLFGKKNNPNERKIILDAARHMNATVIVEDMLVGMDSMPNDSQDPLAYHHELEKPIVASLLANPAEFDPNSLELPGFPSEISPELEKEIGRHLLDSLHIKMPADDNDLFQTPLANMYLLCKQHGIPIINAECRHVISASAAGYPISSSDAFATIAQVLGAISHYDDGHLNQRYADILEIYATVHPIGQSLEADEPAFSALSHLLTTMPHDTCAAPLDSFRIRLEQSSRLKAIFNKLKASEQPLSIALKQLSADEKSQLTQGAMAYINSINPTILNIELQDMIKFLGSILKLIPNFIKKRFNFLEPNNNDDSHILSSLLGIFFAPLIDIQILHHIYQLKDQAPTIFVLAGAGHTDAICPVLKQLGYQQVDAYQSAVFVPQESWFRPRPFYIELDYYFSLYPSGPRILLPADVWEQDRALPITLGNNINWHDENDITCLMRAAERNHSAIVNYLVQQPNLDVTAVDNTGKNALDYARDRRIRTWIEVYRNF